MIERYSFGSITIRGKTYTSDVIVYPDHVKSGWWRKEGHSLCERDLEEVLKWRPNTIIIGTGAYGCMKVPEEVKNSLRLKGIKLIIRRTDDACKIFNKLVKSNKKVVAALHLTC